jgi:hypothetical protein
MNAFCMSSCSAWEEESGFYTTRSAVEEQNPFRIQSEICGDGKQVHRGLWPLVLCHKAQAIAAASYTLHATLPIARCTTSGGLSAI